MEALILIILNDQRCVSPNSLLFLLIQRASVVISGLSTRTPQMLAHLCKVCWGKLEFISWKTQNGLFHNAGKLNCLIINRDYNKQKFPDGSIPPKSWRLSTGITKSVSRSWPSVFSGHSGYLVGPALRAWYIRKMKKYTWAVRSTQKGCMYHMAYVPHGLGSTRLLISLIVSVNCSSTWDFPRIFSSQASTAKGNPAPRNDIMGDDRWQSKKNESPPMQAMCKEAYRIQWRKNEILCIRSVVPVLW